MTDSDSKIKEKDRHRKSKRPRDPDTGERIKDKKKHKKSKEKHSAGLTVVDDDAEDMWVEKNIDIDTGNIPTADALALKSSAVPDEKAPPLPSAGPTESSLKRDDWMLDPPLRSTSTSASVQMDMEIDAGDMEDGYGEPVENGRGLDGSVDFFSSLGTERVKKPKEVVDLDKPKISHRELNPDLVANTSAAPSTSEKRPATPGGPGSQWRMMRLRRVYETAEEEGRPIEEVAIERFGNLQAFEEAREERAILDQRDQSRGRKNERTPAPSSSGHKSFSFSESASSSRSSSFRRPGGAPSTPSPSAGPSNRRLDSLRLQGGPGTVSPSPLSQSHTPIPSVMTPVRHLSSTAVAADGTPTTSKKRALSPSSLNKLQARVLRAKLMSSPDAEELEREYEEAARLSQGAITTDERGREVRTRVEVLPTLDGQGRMYDVGLGGKDEAADQRPGNRRKKAEKVETHARDGTVLRINATDDTTSLGEMLRQEKFGAGMSDQKSLDMEYAKQIMSDGKFENDLDYIDDNAEKLGRQKMRTDAMKRGFAINDYKRTQRALATCPYCFAEDDSPPRAPLISMGTRVYLSCTLTEELVKGHCYIVPMQHSLAMLELAGDDDVWDEVKNFMKTLMRMFADQDQGVLFYETVLSFKQQKHTVIECVPLPWEQFELIPGYFKESILASGPEWSQHKKLIDFSARPGGFRRAMVKNLPYFMVQFDYKGEKGYGHVIEGTSGEGVSEEGEDKEGVEFPSYFAAEIIGGVLELEGRKWRRPRKVDFVRNKERVAEFKKTYAKYDWTGLIKA